MAWFSNHYYCARCGRVWIDEWSATCDDDCPHCGARHMSPSASENLSFVIERRGDEYVVFRSSDDAEDDPDYRQLCAFTTRELAEVYMRFQQGREGRTG